jgi:hypothetical protein
MQTINNTIFSSTAPADGAWRNISNFVAMSVQISTTSAGAPSAFDAGNVWIELSNDPNVLLDGATIAAPSAPTLSQFTPNYSAGYGNASPTVATTYSVQVTYVTAFPKGTVPLGTTQPGVLIPPPETTASGTTALLVTAGNQLIVASPAADPLGVATGYNVYISVGGGPYILQNSLFNSMVGPGNLKVNGPIPLGEPFYLFAYTNSGVQPPATNTTGSPNVGVNATGNISTGGFNSDESVLYFDNPTAAGAWTASSTMAIWSPSCLYFNYLRVRKSTAGTKLTQAYLFGQNG